MCVTSIPGKRSYFRFDHVVSSRSSSSRVASSSESTTTALDSTPRQQHQSKDKSGSIAQTAIYSDKPVRSWIDSTAHPSETKNDRAERTDQDTSPDAVPSELPSLLAPIPPSSPRPLAATLSGDTSDSNDQSSKQRRKRKRKPQKPGKTAKMRERHFVKHNYHDHANDPPGEDGDFELQLQQLHDDASGSENSDQSRKRKGGVTVPFPLKLHDMLEKVADDGHGSVVAWQPHGRAFLVLKPKEFVEVVMPKYFRQTKLTSFQRQLNLYGFARLTKSRDSGAYYHEMFLRGKPFLCSRMVRTKVKGTGFKAASSPDSEPDFYTMPPVGPTPKRTKDLHKETPKVQNGLSMKLPADAHGQFPNPSIPIMPSLISPSEVSSSDRNDYSHAQPTVLYPAPPSSPYATCPANASHHSPDVAHAHPPTRHVQKRSSHYDSFIWPKIPHPPTFRHRKPSTETHDRDPNRSITPTKSCTLEYHRFEHPANAFSARNDPNITTNNAITPNGTIDKCTLWDCNFQYLDPHHRTPAAPNLNVDKSTEPIPVRQKEPVLIDESFETLDPLNEFVKTWGTEYKDMNADDDLNLGFILENLVE